MSMQEKQSRLWVLQVLEIYYYQFAKPFYEIDSGTICIDNENIENYTLGSLRSKLRWSCKMYLFRHHFQ
jgi:hypothetical protein